MMGQPKVIISSIQQVLAEVALLEGLCCALQNVQMLMTV
jgi:hypothetical protein